MGLFPTGEVTGAKTEIRIVHVANGPPRQRDG